MPNNQPEVSKKIDRFNVRVYGILLNDDNEVLISEESYKDFELVKFPGGGVQLGEGLAEALKREWKEELQVEIELEEIFYINDFFVPSFLKDGSQVLSIYYKVKLINSRDFHIKKGIPPSFEKHLTHKWISVSNLSTDTLTLPIDIKVAELLKKK